MVSTNPTKSYNRRNIIIIIIITIIITDLYSAFRSEDTEALGSTVTLSTTCRLEAMLQSFPIVCSEDTCRLLTYFEIQYGGRRNVGFS